METQLQYSLVPPAWCQINWSNRMMKWADEDMVVDLENYSRALFVSDGQYCHFILD